MIKYFNLCAIFLATLPLAAQKSQNVYWQLSSRTQPIYSVIEPNVGANSYVYSEEVRRYGQINFKEIERNLH